jgi:hypothetical protein
MPGKKFICTYFDYNFLPRGLALYYSVKQFHKDFVFFALTFDKKSFKYLSNLNERNLILISIEEYNTYFQTSISRFEDKKQYYFTATPHICLYLLETHPEIDILLYLDADVYVFNSLDILYEEFGDSSIGFCPHRLNPLIKLYAKSYGKYNVGVNLFRNSKTGLECLKQWKEECDNWYPEKPGYPLKFFSDQIFLDTWLEKFEGVKVIENIGVNVCHWNAINYKFSKISDFFYVDNKPLIIYHFSSLKKESPFVWNANSIYAFVSIRKTLLEIYTYYITKIESFGICNSKFESINHSESLRKRLYHLVMSAFLKEKIEMKNVRLKK